MKEKVMVLIKITKDEAEYLRKQRMGYLIHISSATHKGKAKRYYMTEDKKAMRTLQNYRKNKVVYTYYRNDPRERKRK